jgi:hypothetical protein
MQAKHIHSHLRSLDTGWVNWDKTVDTFKAGDPDTEVSGIAVGWMSYTWALRRAVELDCNLFITHEPTYYDHWDNRPDLLERPEVQAKRKFIEANHLVIMRCHDLWDQLPEIGIPDAWGAWLGLGDAVAGEGYFRVYDIAGQTALDVARQVAARTGSFGQEAVQLIGAPDKPVTRVCIGTGAITPLLSWLATYDIDLAICTDDGIAYWREGGYAIDAGLPVIVVHHAVSEEAGMIALAGHLEQRFPDLPVHHIPQRCMYRLVSAD